MSFSPAQCRAARALLNWSQIQLAEASKVATKTLADFERGNRVPYERTLADIQAALEAAGIEFLNHGQPGVRVRKFRKGDRVRCKVGTIIPAGLKVEHNEIGTISIVAEIVDGPYRVSIEFPRTKWPGAPANLFELVCEP